VAQVDEPWHALLRGRSENNTFGMVRRYADGRQKPHQGWDFEASIGTTVHAIADGKVEFVATNSGDYGSQICHSFEFDGKTLYAYYAHLSSILVAKGDSVKQGDSIGATGNTGNAKNLPRKEDHLHFEIREKAICGKGLQGRISPFKVYGVCPLKEAALQNFSGVTRLSTFDLMCIR
jgi:murein DD-endopeptidase MepM/ murein hydrolase activator NlpD